MEKKNSKLHHFDMVGIGIGPFNLSLAALLNKTDNFTYTFFDKKSEFNWHEGMQLDNAKLQVHFLKDLATCVDPTNPYTFLAYLVEQGRIYQFLNCKKDTVSRCEFNNYLQWTSHKIPNLIFGEEIIDINYGKQGFKVISNNQEVYAKHIAIGTGIKPYIPQQFAQFLNETFFHNHDFNYYAKNIDFSNKRVAIIGGGQSGAEVFDSIISQRKKPANILWLSKRQNFQPLDDSCFANEYYTPHYVKYFYELPLEMRQSKLAQQHLTSDGITQEFVDAIYNKLYELKYLHPEETTFELASDHNLLSVEENGKSYNIKSFDQDLNEYRQNIVDIIILATGYRSNIPSFLETLLGNQSKDWSINFDYSINWQHSKTNKIFIQNACKNTHGVADPNLSLAAWKNSLIVNSLAGKDIYETHTQQHIMGRANIHSKAYADKILSAA